ncbi:unnamed protein product [Vitrella brassicaformis CCMP3155]|uniref:Tryptophan synthase beta chain-like PALP domain-containing protein n=2 Tax=Vitrella brassicaformis TaxID=1169539 RepID=A0A0G4GRN7_VITBC|nr:unnamed protein product [Vitrella brassicaformis CCMP3155]|eukprot:CEM33219.1 unnamed protein product [Vitrella brassicaformis CCMP3155]
MRSLLVLSALTSASVTIHTGHFACYLHPSPSPLQEINAFGQMGVMVKRDDLLHLHPSDINGNKARKFLALHRRLFDSDSSTSAPRVIVSHGGVQSNALRALSALVRTYNERGGSCRLLYYCKKIPSWLRERPVGTFAAALEQGVEFRPLANAEYAKHFGGDAGSPSLPQTLMPQEEDVLFIPQGGACGSAEEGVALLAEELLTQLPSLLPPAAAATIVLPGGTGSTALFLARHMQRRKDVEVVVVPVVGDWAYMARQMSRLDHLTGGHGVFPSIAVPSTPPSVFGEPTQGNFQLWRELVSSTGIDFDLMYSVPMWGVLREAWEGARGSVMCWDGGAGEWAGRRWPIGGGAEREERMCVVLHCGGAEGNVSWLARARYKGLAVDV